MIRRFSLINEIGQEFDLNSVKDGFMYAPSGLGYELEYAYQKTGTRWNKLYMKDTQAQITGEIVYSTAHPYEAQVGFLEFIRGSKKLTLKKQTDAGTFYKDVDLVSYEISEIGDDDRLHCPVVMIGTSLWYSKTAEVVNITSQASGLRYPYRFPSSFNDYTDGILQVNNYGSVPAAFTIEFYGAVTNPAVAVEVNGEEIAKVEIDASILTGEKIIYSSRDGRIYCYKGTAQQVEAFKRSGITDGLTNLALGFDLGNDNFIKLPVGGSRLHVTADTALFSPIFVEVFKEYRAV